MDEHKYRVGETVGYTPARVVSTQTVGTCQITRLLSTDSGDPQYRVKCPAEGFERVVRESELSESAAEAARAN